MTLPELLTLRTALVAAVGELHAAHDELTRLSVEEFIDVRVQVDRATLQAVAVQVGVVDAAIGAITKRVGG